MKKFSIFLLPFILLGGSVIVRGQCVNCKPSSRNPDILVCTASASGGYECQANDTACAVSVACPGSRPPIGELRVEPFEGEVELTAAAIREVASQHPRFALALAFLQKHGLLGKESKVFLIPREVTELDVAIAFYPAEQGMSLSRPLGLQHQYDELSLEHEARGTNRRKRAPAPPVIYKVTVEKLGGEQAVLRLQVENGHETDPPYTSLEVDLIANRDGMGWQASGWRIH